MLRSCCVALVLAACCGSAVGSPAGGFSLRLVGGGRPCQGRVEVTYNNTNGTVCNRYWKPENSQVVCKSLNYSGGSECGSECFGSGSSSSRIWLDAVNCTGNESSLDQCQHRNWGSSLCTHSQDVGVICSECDFVPPNNSQTIRLVRSATQRSCEGRVEVFFLGRWGTVCDDYWDNIDANVACQQLNISSRGQACGLACYGSGNASSPIWLDDMGCYGNETNLYSCPHNALGDHNCAHFEDAGLRCGECIVAPTPFPTAIPPTPAPTFASPLPVRLVSNSSNSTFNNVTCQGRVEIFYNNSWGTVCDDYWTDTNAAVICRQLNISGAATACSNACFGAGTGMIWLDDVFCVGNEASVDRCVHLAYGSHNCVHAEDAGVRCGRCVTAVPTPAPTVPLPIRLVGGSELRCEGRVEVFYNNSWGTVCDDYWNDNDAQVACRQLGFSGPYRSYSEARFGPGNGSIWLDDVMCRGNESYLDWCPHRPYGAHDCTHYEDAGVSCGPCINAPTRAPTPQPTSQPTPQPTLQEPVSVRLIGSNNSTGPGVCAGRVEVLFDGSWGTVCDDFFTDLAAQVVCRQLGLSGGIACNKSCFGQGTGIIMLDDVVCTGQETSLDQCQHQIFEHSNCFHNEDVGVNCNCALSPTSESTTSSSGTSSSTSTPSGSGTASASSVSGSGSTSSVPDTVSLSSTSGSVSVSKSESIGTSSTSSFAPPATGGPVVTEPSACSGPCIGGVIAGIVFAVSGCAMFVVWFVRRRRLQSLRRRGVLSFLDMSPGSESSSSSLPWRKKAYKLLGTYEGGESLMSGEVLLSKPNDADS